MSIEHYPVMIELAPKLDKSEQREELDIKMAEFLKGNMPEQGPKLCKTVAEVLESKRCTTNLNQTISHEAKKPSWGSFKS